jgi:hypothetical protein
LVAKDDYSGEMNILVKCIKQRPIISTLLAVLLSVVFTGMILIGASRNTATLFFNFTNAHESSLPADKDIWGEASFDRDSYLAGETIHYHARILYRDNKVEPDLDQFVRSAIFTPLEKHGNHTDSRSLGNGVKEFNLDYLLQGVDVEPDTLHQMDPVVLFYKVKGENSRELQSLRVPTPNIYFSTTYPKDVSTIPLKTIKGEIGDPYFLRQILFILNSTLLLALGIYILWFYGRKRTIKELSPTEVVWREFQDMDRANIGDQNSLSGIEKIVTKLLYIRTGLTAAAFWSGENPGDPFWKDFVVKVRNGFLDNYRKSKSIPGQTSEVLSDLENILSAIVAEDRLKLEQEPDLFKRLMMQPRVLFSGVTLVCLAITILLVASVSNLGIPSDLIKYNQIVRTLSSNIPMIDESTPLEALGKEAESPFVKSASLYNAGTIRGHIKPSENPPLQESELLQAVFQDDFSVETYLDNPDSVEMLFKSAGWLLKGKINLQDAVRASPDDINIIQNLELISKRYNAVATAINRLFEHMQGNADIKLKSKLETMVDVLNKEWPDVIKNKDEDEKDKNTPTYKVSEQF